MIYKLTLEWDWVKEEDWDGLRWRGQRGRLHGLRWRQLDMEFFESERTGRLNIQFWKSFPPLPSSQFWLRGWKRRDRKGKEKRNPKLNLGTASIYWNWDQGTIERTSSEHGGSKALERVLGRQGWSAMTVLWRGHLTKHKDLDYWETTKWKTLGAVEPGYNSEARRCGQSTVLLGCSRKWRQGDEVASVDPSFNMFVEDQKERRQPRFK